MNYFAFAVGNVRKAFGMRDPIEEDPRTLEERELEMQREFRWAAFVQEVREFSESEGWPETLAAVSRAMRDQDAEKRELMDRR